MVIPVTGRMAGLGDDPYCTGGVCLSAADDGSCVDCVYPNGNPNQTTIPTSGGFYGTFTPPQSGDTGVYVTSAYFDSGGDLVLNLSDGSYHTVLQNGQHQVGTGPAPAAAPAGGRMSAQQASAWPGIVGTIAAAGIRIGTVATLPAGATLLPNGTILGSGQSLVSPGGSINSQFAAVFSNPMLLLAGGAVLVLLVASGR